MLSIRLICVWLSALSIFCLDIASAQYIRAPAGGDLNLTHARLRKSKDPHYPEQIHLALAGPGSVAVSWVTHPEEDAALLLTSGNQSGSSQADNTDGCSHLGDLPLQPTAQIGLASGDYTINATGSFTCYASTEYKSGALHTVLLGRASPLSAGARYYYRTGDPNFGWSKEYSFTNAPTVSPNSVPYKLGLIGDLGQTEDSAQTLGHLDDMDVASVLNVGDLSYADSYQPRWDSWNRLLEFHAARVPWMHIEGNHEYELLNGKPGFVAYERRYWFPSKESKSGSPFYYSYETGPLHVVMLGCYVDYLKDSDQAAWLKKDLAGVDRGRTPWVVVGMHAPWYNSNTAHQGEVDDMRDDLEPILYQYGVDIVFAGHVHAYERSDGGVLGSERTACAPTYVTIGDGGNREGLSTGYLSKPEWSAVRESSFGMGTFTVQNTTHAVWQWHRNDDAVSQVADEHWVVRDTGCQGSVIGNASVAYAVSR